MLFFSSRHPSLDVLSDLQRAASSLDTHGESLVDAAVVTHVRSCAICQSSLATLAALAAETVQLTGPVSTDALKMRVMATRATGARLRLPMSPSVVGQRPRKWWMPITAAAAALLAITIGSLFTSTPSVEAGATAGTMTLSTTTPRNGERVTVRYSPGASLGRFSALRLRGRLRTVDAQSYARNVVAITVANFSRAKDGTFATSFTLPDSIVFAALAVEDDAATEIDDQGGRTWEVSRADVNTKVTFAALEQRAHDLMGRNWEEVTSTAERMVRDYPSDIRAWSWLRTSQSWRGLPYDSINAYHRAHEAAFDKSLRAQPSLSGEQIGQMYWYARGLDSTGKAYWRERLLRDAPNNSFAIQNRIFDILDKFRKDHDTTFVLLTLDNLWQSAPNDRRDQVANYATGIAVATRGSALVRRWTDRLLLESKTMPNAALNRHVATEFIGVPSLHTEGLNRLRSELVRLASPEASSRALDETAADYHARLDRSMRSTYAALGRALVRDGQHRAALDTLALAAAEGWDYDVIRAVRSASLSAGDTSRALEMNARLVVDPRTPAAEVETLTIFGRTRIGVTTWDASVVQQRREFVQRMLVSTRTRTIARPVNILALDGSAQELRAMTKGQVTIVAYWSRFCEPAITSLRPLHNIAARLAEVGIRTITIVEETEVSPALTAFLKAHDVSLPVFLDAKSEVSQTFNQWGTPSFYVLDPQGHIVFAATSDVDQLLVNAEAVRLADRGVK